MIVLRHMWQVFNGAAQCSQAPWPQRKATLRRRSMQMLHIFASSRSATLVSRYRNRSKSLSFSLSLSLISFRFPSDDTSFVFSSELAIETSPVASCPSRQMQKWHAKYVSFNFNWYRVNLFQRKRLEKKGKNRVPWIGCALTTVCPQRAQPSVMLLAGSSRFSCFVPVRIPEQSWHSAASPEPGTLFLVPRNPSDCDMLSIRYVDGST